MDVLSKLPPGIELGFLSAEIFAVLEKYTAFPWPVLTVQCQRVGADPTNIDATQLGLLIPLLALGVERFTSPETGHAVEQDLGALLRRSV
jgi:hypothetical protein